LEFLAPGIISLMAPFLSVSVIYNYIEHIPCLSEEFGILILSPAHQWLRETVKK
jgi:hypothetical protein